MRKFFKSLAVLLALVLIVGVIPAAAADSLSMQKEKVLYLDGSKGAKEDGTKCKTSYKKLVANMIKGFDKDTMSVVLSSADKDIVKTSKAGRIFAKSLGTTTVTVTVYNADETEIFKQDLKVIVKKNATDVTVTGIADGDSFKVGQTVDITLPRAGVDTDARELTVDKADNVELKAGEKSRTWTAKFVKAGDVTFTARAYQSAKYPATTAKKDIKVSIANPAPTAIKVVASNAYELTFDTDVEAAGLFKDAKEIANDACYYMLNDTKVTFSAVKAVKATGNTVKVTMYDNFTAGTTYYVVINGSDPLQFVIAGNAAKDVESIAIISDTAVVNTASPITVALYNADGVDITSSVGTGSVSLASTNLNSYVDGLTLNMYNVGDVTDLTATFVYYDANNNYQEVKKTITKKITAIAASADVFKALVYSVDNKADLPSKNYSGAKTYVALGDAGYKFKVQLVYTNGNNEYDMAVDGVNTFNGKALYAKIPEESVALLSSNNGDGTYNIVPNTVGRTNVFIGYDENGSFKTVAVAPIEVKEARYPATLTVKPTKSNLNTDVADSITFNAEVKDQYGDYINATLQSDQNTQSAAVATLDDKAWVAGTTGKYSLTVDDTEITYAPTKSQANIVFTTKLTDWNSKAAAVGSNFTAKDAGVQDTVKDNLAFTNNGASTLDTSITGWTSLKAASLVAQTSSNGFYTGNVGFTHVATAPAKANYVSSGAAVATFELLIKKDGAAVNPADFGNLTGFLTVNAGAGTVQLKNFDDSAAAVKKLPKGNYTFTLYKIKSAATAANVVISSQTVVVNVTDNQTAPVFTQLAEKTTTGNAAAGNFTDCFKFTFAGATYQAAGVAYDASPASASTNAYFVKKATVTVNFQLNDEITWGGNTGKSFNLDCTINKLIKTE